METQNPKLDNRSARFELHPYGVLVCWMLSVGCTRTLYYEDRPAFKDTASDTGQGAVDGEKAGICGASTGRLFSDDYPWNQPVEDSPLDAESDAVIGYLDEIGSRPGLFEIEGANGAAADSYGMAVLIAKKADEPVPFDIRESDFWTPHCDHVPVPLPSRGAVEGETGYACLHGGDCHLVVLDKEACLLYEMYRADRTDERFTGGCLAVWDLSSPYTPTLRGDCCTGAEAAGLPIAPLTFSADEIARGTIPHALRFSLPSAFVRAGIFVRPATHTSTETTGGAAAPPRGARLRLKKSYSDADLTPPAKIVAAALKKYGMILTDPGEVTFIGEDERFTVHTWREVGVDSNALVSLRWIDFEVVDGGERFSIENCRCERDPLDE